MYDREHTEAQTYSASASPVQNANNDNCSSPTQDRCFPTRSNSLSTASSQRDDELPPSTPFTDGPMRIVMAHDGKNECLAVLLDKGLFCSMQGLVTTQLGVLKTQLALDKARFEVELVEKYGQQHKELEDVKQKARELNKQRKEIEATIPELQEAQQRCETLEKELSVPNAELESLRDELQRALTHALREAKLLTFPVIRPSAGLRSGPQASTSNYSAGSSSCMGPPAVNSAGFRPGGTNIMASKEETAYRNAIVKLNHTREILIEAQYQLDCRKQHYGEDLALHHYNVSEGVWSFTTTEFDSRQVEIGQILTRKLIQAEEAFDEAKTQVKAGNSGSDAESSYYGDYFEPSLVGIECEVLEKSVRPRVELWQDGLVGPGSLENTEPLDLDQWDSKPVDVSDSESAIAFDQYYRKRIDRWEGMRSAARGQKNEREEVQNEDERDRKRRRSW